MNEFTHTTLIPGCFRITPRRLDDERGFFCKTFCESAFRAAGLAADYREAYWSRSRRRVLRGLHFQAPPHDCDKLVSCMFGQVLDVVVDLRVNSPTFGLAVATPLDGESGQGLYVPRGLAHGFYVCSETAIVAYSVTAEYSPSYDTGILWNSIDYRWPDDTPIVSTRDAGFPALQHFRSPFLFSPA